MMASVVVGAEVMAGFGKVAAADNRFINNAALTSCTSMTWEGISFGQETCTSLTREDIEEEKIEF